MNQTVILKVTVMPFVTVITLELSILSQNILLVIVQKNKKVSSINAVASIHGMFTNILYLP